MTTTGIRAGANAAEGRFAYVAETAWGTAPSTPTFQKLRITSETLMPAKTTVRSDEVRPDRNVVDEIEVAQAAAGDINFELSDATLEALLESLMFNTWSGSPADTLKNGYGAGQAFTFERTLLLPDASYEYHRFVGGIINTMSLNCQAGQKITGTLGVMAKSMSRAVSAIAGSTYTDPNTEEIMNAADDFASLSVTGLSPAPTIKGLTMQVTNNLRRQDEVGSKYAAGFGPGRFEVTGTMQAYFETGDLYAAFLDHTDLALSWVLGSTSGEKYRFTLPTIKLTGNPGSNIGGNDQDVMMDLNFTAIYDRLSSPLLACTLQIERNV